MKLSDRVSAAPSTIHGTGLFARQKFAKGEYIGTYEGPAAKRNGTYVLWVTDENGDTSARSGRNLLRFLNHQRPPNAEFDGYDLFAKKAIKPGDEITFDYGWEDETA